MLSASLVAHAVSFLVCHAMSVRSDKDVDVDFDVDFGTIQHVTGDVDLQEVEAAAMGTDTAHADDDLLDPTTEGRHT